MSGWIVAEVGWYEDERWAWWIKGWRVMGIWYGELEGRKRIEKMGMRKI